MTVWLPAAVVVFQLCRKIMQNELHPKLTESSEQTGNKQKLSEQYNLLAVNFVVLLTTTVVTQEQILVLQKSYLKELTTQLDHHFPVPL